MTKTQAKLLKRLISADRESRETNIDSDRWVEVGSINSVNPRTVESLDAHGLVEQRGDMHRSEVAIRKDLAW